ncbi:MAG: hypothetical protein E7465_09730 [Ruminococcaceae bacterium]|nr:hypothetical protein [Oscillospiraceae bacterium]
MKYKNAQDVLPDKLLKELQKYVSGETLYVPNADEKKPWGESSGARSYYRQRNAEIRQKHKAGRTIDQLAEEYSLSADSIRKILN